MAVDANKVLTTLKDIVDFIKTASRFAVGFGLLIILAVVVIQTFGLPTFGLPTMAHEPFAYYAGGYWLVCRVFS